MAYIGCLTDPRIILLLLPHLVFVLLISILGHKEWRFIIYTVPAFNIAGARGLKYLYVVLNYPVPLNIIEPDVDPFSSTSRRKATFFGQISFLVALGALTSNFLLTGILTRISMANYPGGVAIATFHQLLPASRTRKRFFFLACSHTQPPSPVPPHVHISNLAAQSGTSLFQHLNSPPYPPTLFLWPNSTPPTVSWTYNKTENLTLHELSSSPHFTHLISEIPPTEPEVLKHWRLMRSIPAFDHVVFNKNLLLRKPQELPWRILDLIRIEQKDVLWIYERR